MIDQSTEFAVRHPNGTILDSSPSRRYTEERLARYQEQWPAAVLVSRTSVHGNWVTVGTEPTIPTVPPRRGDAVETWLKAQRDACFGHATTYNAIDGLLDEYRLHADTGTPLDEHACENGNVDDCHGCYETAKTEQQ